MSRRSDRIASVLGEGGMTFTPSRSRFVWGGMGGLGRKLDIEVAPPDPGKGVVAPPGTREIFQRQSAARKLVAVNAPPQAERLSRDAAAAEFIDWLGRSYPGLVESLLEAVGVEAVIARDGALGATEEKTLVTKLFDIAEVVLPAYLQLEQQRDVLAIQIERAKQGLPPLETGQYAPSVQVGLDQETVRRLADEATARAGAFASSPLPWVLGGGVVLAVLMMRNKPTRRRRA